MVRKHYQLVGKKLAEFDHIFSINFNNLNKSPNELFPINDKNAKTAVFFVTKHYGV